MQVEMKRKITEADFVNALKDKGLTMPQAMQVKNYIQNYFLRGKSFDMSRASDAVRDTANQIMRNWPKNNSGYLSVANITGLSPEQLKTEVMFGIRTQAKIAALPIKATPTIRPQDKALQYKITLKPKDSAVAFTYTVGCNTPIESPFALKRLVSSAKPGDFIVEKTGSRYTLKQFQDMVKNQDIVSVSKLPKRKMT